MIANELLQILGPIIATIVSTIMGTEAFKWVVDKTKLDLNSRTVTWIVWGAAALIVWLILEWFPFWFILVLGVLAAGGYSWWLKPIINAVFKRDASARKRNVRNDPPVGGVGGGPVP